jgi:hypothetical protein
MPSIVLCAYSSVQKYQTIGTIRFETSALLFRVYTADLNPQLELVEKPSLHSSLVLIVGVGASPS